MFFVELRNALVVEFGHLKFRNFETASVDSVQNFTEALVGVGLDHSEGS